MKETWNFPKEKLKEKIKRNCDWLIYLIQDLRNLNATLLKLKLRELLEKYLQTKIPLQIIKKRNIKKNRTK